MTVNQILPFPLLFFSLPSSSTPSSSRTALGQPSTWRVLFQTIPIDEVNATSPSHATSYSLPFFNEKTEAAFSEKEQDAGLPQKATQPAGAREVA